jgi:predicted AAA+ superfamily ATPase
MYSIQRALNLDKLVKPGRALVLYGARQVGKTTLIQEFLKNYTSRYKIYTGEDISLQLLFNELKLSELDNLVNTLDLLVIDEALIITNLGKGIKLIIDRNPNLKVILTGSSSFELANHITEPLTGRKRTQSLLPISIKELKDHWGSFDLKNKLNELLIYGSYPEIITENSLGEKKEAIIEITNSYLFKDILSFLNLKKADLLFKLTKLLALQIGSEVNVNELSKNLQLDNKTVNHYLDILEKSFVIKLLPSFSNNQRSEIKKS